MSYVQRRLAPASARPPGSDADAAIRRITALADLLDSRFEIPGLGVRIGLDAIVGLVPVIGDTATTVAGAFIVAEAVRLGARKRVLARMSANLALDWLIGLVPVADIFFDVAYKANNRNARLLLREHQRGKLRRPEAGDRRGETGNRRPETGGRRREA